jgi:SAM-dependent methyltransferase
MIQGKISDVRAGYDAIAEEYARRIYDELRLKPRDRELLDRFAESVRGAGVACDLGCGPGHIARYLQGCGIEVCGMDLSDGMIDCARRLNPGIPFMQGDMRALPVDDDAWAGIAAFYAIVNFERDRLAQPIGEMMRALRPDGKLLLSFHIGEDDSQVEEALWGLDVTLQFTFFRVSTVAACIRNAGLTIDEIIERDPYPPEVEYQSRRAYIFAHKPVTISKTSA